MKLYTEDQIKDMFLEWATTNESRDDIMRDFTPIELPTEYDMNERVINVISEYILYLKLNNIEEKCIQEKVNWYIDGAKWVIEKIEKQK